MYAPQLGRFISRDPIGYGFRSRPDLNLYEFVSSNGLVRVDPYGLDWTDIGTWFEDWVLETGPANPVFLPLDPHTQALKDSAAGDQMRQAYTQGGCKNITNGSYGTFEAFVDTVGDPTNGTLAFVGGFLYNATNNGDGTVTFTIHNQVSLYSFFYHIPFVPHAPRGGTIPLGGNVNQTFTWTQSVDCTPPAPPKQDPIENKCFGPGLHVQSGPGIST